MEKQAIVETINKLLILQERDNRLAQCHRELNGIPARKQEIELLIAHAREALHQAKEALKSKQVAVKQLDVEIDSYRQQITKLREQQFQIKSNEEFKALNNEIAHLQEKVKELEDREIELMEQAEQAQLDVTRRKSELDQDEISIKEKLENLGKRREVLEVEVQQIQQERETRATGIDPTWLSRYNRVMDNKKDMALVSIENNTCSRCHMNLPAQVIHDVKKAETIVTCYFCGRILYWTR